MVAEPHNPPDRAHHAPPPRRESEDGLSHRRGLRVALKSTLAGGVCLAVGFMWFVWRLPTDEVVLDRNADGIVVLTGGASRIADAMELLAAGRGKRLLISGVYPTTTPGEIARPMPEYERLFNCCVDLDRSAVNTVGNAVETRRWVKSRGFRSLIVVTSSYHMPRTMVELARQMPDVALVPFPVVTEKMRAEPWWFNLSTVRLLFSEYVKYVLAQIRLWLEPVLIPGGLVSRHGSLSG